ILRAVVDVVIFVVREETVRHLVENVDVVTDVLPDRFEDALGLLVRFPHVGARPRPSRSLWAIDHRCLPSSGYAQAPIKMREENHMMRKTKVRSLIVRSGCVNRTAFCASSLDQAGSPGTWRHSPCPWSTSMPPGCLAPKKSFSRHSNNE